MPNIDLGKVVGEQGPEGPVAQGTMMEATYDPTGKAQDVFAYADTAKKEAKDYSAPKTHASQHGASGSDPLTPAAIGAVPASEKGKASGVATLGTDGKIQSSQLPEMNYAELTHYHDDRYYTESEIDTKLSTLDNSNPWILLGTKSGTITGTTSGKSANQDFEVPFTGEDQIYTQLLVKFTATASGVVDSYSSVRGLALTIAGLTCNVTYGNGSDTINFSNLPCSGEVLAKLSRATHSDGNPTIAFNCQVGEVTVGNPDTSQGTYTVTVPVYAGQYQGGLSSYTVTFTVSLYGRSLR